MRRRRSAEQRVWLGPGRYPGRRASWRAITDSDSDGNCDADSYVDAKDFANTEASPHTRASPIAENRLIRV